MKITEIEKQIKKPQKELDKLKKNKYEIDGCKIEDIFEAQYFEVVKIDNLEWMREDLAIKPSFGIGDEVGVWEHDSKYYYNWTAANIVAREMGNGWRIPTREEFEALYEELGEDFHKVMKPELNGYCSSTGVLNYQGSLGGWWSSTPYSVTHAYYLYFPSSAVYPSNLDYKNYGLAVRLVRKVI